MPVLLLSIFACVTLHLLTIAATAHAIGVRVQTVSLGIGPVGVLVFRAGRLRSPGLRRGGHLLAIPMPWLPATP